MAARGKAGTWGLGCVVSSELWRYREFFGDAGISGYLAAQFRPQALEERNGGGGCRSCSGSLGSFCQVMVPSCVTATSVSGAVAVPLKLPLFLDTVVPVLDGPGNKA